MYTTTNLLELKENAKRKLSPQVWDYIEGGAESESTLQTNAEAFTKLSFTPRVLQDTSTVSTKITLFGGELDIPLLLAPVSPLRLVSEEAEIPQVVAAHRTGIIPVVSGNSHFSLEYLAKQSNGEKWFQLYAYANMDWVLEIVQRVEHAGYRAIVITVDAIHHARRERSLRSGFTMPAHVKMGNFEQCGTVPEKRRDGSYQMFPLTWSDIALIKERTNIPVLIKGIMHPNDVKLALDYGVDGIVISNHGGRQLDYATSPINQLPIISKIVAQTIPLIVDGGIMRGSDIAKAISLGASAVLLGRGYVYGLALDGVEGVVKSIELIRNEYSAYLKQLGVSSTEELSELINLQ